MIGNDKRLGRALASTSFQPCVQICTSSAGLLSFKHSHVGIFMQRAAPSKKFPVRSHLRLFSYLVFGSRFGEALRASVPISHFCMLHALGGYQTISSFAVGCVVLWHMLCVPHFLCFPVLCMLCSKHVWQVSFSRPAGLIQTICKSCVKICQARIQNVQVICDQSHRRHLCNTCCPMSSCCLGL